MTLSQCVRKHHTISARADKSLSNHGEGARRIIPWLIIESIESNVSIDHQAALCKSKSLAWGPKQHQNMTQPQAGFVAGAILNQLASSTLREDSKTTVSICLEVNSHTIFIDVPF